MLDNSQKRCTFASAKPPELGGNRGLNKRRFPSNNNQKQSDTRLFRPPSP